MKKLIPVTVIAILVALGSLGLWIHEKSNTEDLDRLCRTNAQMAHLGFEEYAERGDEVSYWSAVADFKAFVNTYLQREGEATPEYLWCNELFGFMTASPHKVMQNVDRLTEALLLLRNDFNDPNAYQKISSLNHLLMNVPDTPTDLEFDITRNVENFDFSGYAEVTGWFGARQYYGKDYAPAVDGTAPEHYVTYLITAYPDYADGGQYVTQIEVTDPEVRVKGLTVNSTFEEFRDIFVALGFKVTKGETAYVAEKGNITYRLTEGKTILITAAVTNREGIIF